MSDDEVEIIWGDGHPPVSQVHRLAEEAEAYWPGFIRELAPATAEHLARLDHAAWLAASENAVN